MKLRITIIFSQKYGVNYVYNKFPYIERNGHFPAISIRHFQAMLPASFFIQTLKRIRDVINIDVITLSRYCEKLPGFYSMPYVVV